MTSHEYSAVSVMSASLKTLCHLDRFYLSPFSWCCGLWWLVCLVMSREHCRSERKELLSIEWRRRNEWNVGGASGVRSTDSLVKIEKWSDGEQWVTDRDGASEESEEVITRSRMWFWLWVGKLICWVRWNDDKIERNWEVAWSEWLSRWMLKSPVMIN